MSTIAVAGCGAVTPAGWGVAAMQEALHNGTALPAKEQKNPGGRPFLYRQVPTRRAEFMAHPRLRRTSPISHYTVAAALEALGPDTAKVTAGELELGLIFCVMCGCVNYSRRFYDELLKDPATASPLVFPETVFNAPASHLTAYLGSKAINYTVVGDQSAMLGGLALAAHWLELGRVDGCLVLAAEETDWLTASAATLFDSGFVMGEGAGALYLKRRSDVMQARPVLLETITDPMLLAGGRTRAEAARLSRAALGELSGTELLCDGLLGSRRSDRDEAAAWQDWPGPRLSPRKLFGESFTASGAWQCVAAVAGLESTGASRGIVSLVGSNEQALAATFFRARQGALAES